MQRFPPWVQALKGIIAAFAVPRGRAAVAFALVSACGALAFALHLHHPRPGLAADPQHSLSIWIELGLFGLSASLSALVCRRRLVVRARQTEPGPNGPGANQEGPRASHAGAHGPHQQAPLPQGAQSLLAILARALGQAEVALFLRQGSRFVCRAQEPAPFGAQAFATSIAANLKEWQHRKSGQVVWLKASPKGRAAIAVPLSGEQDSHPGHRAPAPPWAVLLVQRHQGVLTSADQDLSVSVARQIAVSLQLEQALRTAQADRLRLEHMATTDSLTELANRRHFMRIFALQLARAQRYTRRLSLIFLDIDHFKQVNDTFGHAVGDEVLRGVAQVLRHTARKTDTVARYGGEEFAILMEETGLPGAQRIAERIQEALKKQSFGPETAPFFKTVSIGVATFPEHGDEPENLIACADEALYRAKRSGRDQITLYSRAEGSCTSESR